jgi:phytoene/squalene synthetase
MSDSTALDSFLEKWRARWPEWSVAEIFVPVERRGRAVAWFALLQEFEDALNIDGDPLPADAKLAWWSEELRGWANQRSRHPLGRTLEPVRAPWARLADTLPGLPAVRAQAEDAEAAFAALAAHADAVAAVEAVVLGRAVPAQALAAQVLAGRLTHVGPAAAPVAVARQAGRGEHAALRHWGRLLQQRWGGPRQGARERRILGAYAQARLARFIKAGEPAALPSHAALLFTGWRAARGD